MEVNSKLFTFAQNRNRQVWTKVSLIKNDIRQDLKLSGTETEMFSLVNSVMAFQNSSCQTFDLLFPCMSWSNSLVSLDIIGCYEMKMKLPKFWNLLFKLWVKWYSVFCGETSLGRERGDCITRVNFSTLRMWNILWTHLRQDKYNILDSYIKI